jgi:nucleoid DNA-binding protein
MTKADIVNEISKSTGIEKLTVQKAVEAFIHHKDFGQVCRISHLF